MGIQSARGALSNLEEINDKLRRDILKNIEPHGAKSLSDLPGMMNGERTKWFFWNLHENLEAIRKLEPVLVGQVIRGQLTISDGLSMCTEKLGLEKRIELSCKWHLLLKSDTYQNKDAFTLGDGWIDLNVNKAAPPHPTLQDKQKGYLDADNPLYPNQLYLYGWITEDVWREVQTHLYNAGAHCQTDVFLRDNFLFPVKPGLDFVSGPAGSIGLANIEFRVSSQPRMNSWVKN